MEIKKLNANILKCRKCKLHKTRNKPIIGEGPLNSKYMLIAQAPGKTENKKERMFVGPSGKFLRNIFKGLNIKFNSIYKTNLIKCYIPNSRRPNLNIVNSCIPFLKKEIKIIDPDYIFTLGFYSTRSTFDLYNLSIDNKNQFKDNFGKLFWSKNTKLMAFPHPASGLYNKKYKPGIRNLFQKINIITKECKWFKVCPMNKFYNQGKIDRKWVELYCKGDSQSCKRYQQEEKGIYHPDNMMPDGSINNEL